MSDPSWFYSSLAQSAATIVGLGGAFYIFRLQTFVSEWTTAAEQLPVQQRRWSEARFRVRQEESRFGEPRTVDDHFEDGVSPDSAQEERERWSDLREHLELRETAAFPGELLSLAALLGAVLLAGCFIPLVMLGGDGNLQQVGIVSPFAALSVLTGVVMYRRASSAFTRWQTIEMWSTTLASLEEARLQDEASEAQERWYAEERERRSDTSP